VGNKLKSFAFAICWGLFGLSMARAALDTWPALAGNFPRWPLALLSALAFAAAGLRLQFQAPNLKPQNCIPLLIPAITLLNPVSNPLRDWALLFGAMGGIAAIALTTKQPNHPTTRFLYPLSLGLIASILYLCTLAPTVGEADTFEFQVNAIRLGVSHGSGYPLYLLLAKLFSLLPAGGTAAFRVNLSSAFFGVTAALMAYALARALGAPRPASWVGGLSLAASIGLWSRAVEAEVYTLHVTLIGVLLWLAISDQQSAISNQRYWLAFVFGLSMTNHLTTILLAPAVAVALLPALPAPRLTPHALRRNPTLHALLYPLLFALGLSLYLYLPLRWPAVNNGEIMTWEMFRHFITGQEAQGALRLDAWLTDFSRYAIVGRKALDQFGWPGAITALLGLAALFRKRPSAAFVTLAAYGAFAFFGLSFYVPDPDYSSFLLPAHLVQVVWIALGIHTVVEATALFTTKALGHEFTRNLILDCSLFIVHCSFFFLPASLIWINLAKVDQSSDWREYRLGQTILSQPLDEGAAILADSELIAPLYYLQVAEGLRPDLDIIVLAAEEYYRAELDARASAGQKVYLGRYLPRLAEAYYLHSVGPLTKAKLEPSPLPDHVIPPGTNFVGAIRLLGFTLDSSTAPTDSQLPITLYWQAVEPPPENYLVILRLVDSVGAPTLISPPEVPVGQMYPTAAWPTNDVVADFHNFTLDLALAPGGYFLQVGLFPPFSNDGLKNESGGMWITLADVTLTEPTTEPQIQNPVRMRFGEAWLMGYDAPDTAAPGSQVTATLYWMSAKDTTAQWCAEQNCRPVTVRGGNHITVSRVVFDAPNEGGEMSLRVGVAGENGECGWWPAPPAPSCELARLSVEGAALAPNAINFDNKIVLDTIRIETAQASPGETVIVSAQWRGLAPMDENYTVFVHLLGPDGVVHGQVDSWPVQGTRPTTQWPINQPIADRFEVRVPDDAPRGEYKVEVGWYLLATLDRLPVVTASGVAVDDKFVIEGLRVGDR